MTNNKAKRVMCIDDDEAIRLTIRLTLEMAGYEVIEAINGLDALKYLHAGKLPDLILVDWSMGGGELNGDAFLAAKRGDTYLSAIPVVVCSGTVDRKTAFTLGAKAVLSKPFAIDDLLGLVGAQCAVLVEAPECTKVILREAREAFTAMRRVVYAPTH
jgi:CheY-like chemotaxis protein